MDTAKRQHLQDIYQTDEQGNDDFTQQVSQEIREEREREARNQRVITTVLGATVLILGIALVVVVAKRTLDVESDVAAPEAITQKYIPRYSLSSEKQWVLDFNNRWADPVWEGEGDRPFSADWIKKAAYNLVLAEQASQFEKLEEAADFYENALEILPDLEGVRVPLGMIYFKLNAFDKAVELLGDVPEADLTHDILNNLGAACIEAKEFERAEEYLVKSIEMKPTYAEALKNMAVLCREQGKDADAVRKYEEYFDQRPADVDARHNFALYLIKIGNWERAAEHLDILTMEITDMAILFQLKARAESKLGNKEKALAAIRRAAQLTDPTQALLWMDEAEFDQLRESEHFQEIVRTLQE